MKNPYRLPRLSARARLAIFDDKDGVTIAGNKEGLRGLGDLLRSMARWPYPKGDDGLYHEHLGITWRWEIKRKALKIHIGRKALRFPTVRQSSSGKDLTIHVSKRPWKYLPDKMR